MSSDAPLRAAGEQVGGGLGGGGGSGPPARLHFRLTSDPAEVKPVRLAVEKWAVSLGWADDEAGELGLCINEALANVIEHAYGFEAGKPIEVWAEMVEAGVEVRVRDWGSGVDPSRLPPKPRDPMTPGGLGLICLREMMDRVEYAPQPDGGVLLTMVRYRRGGRGEGDGGGSHRDKQGDKRGG
ncbi:MAG: ATP-binding protein [Tepidisphaerales bacterium]